MSTLDAYTEPLRVFLSNDFYSTRKTMKLTQERMAELLEIDVRSYGNLEHGETLCQTKVLLMYMRRCKPDREAFLHRIDQIMEAVEIV